MKKAIIFILLFAISLMCISGCGNNKSDDSMSFELYFSNNSKDSLITEKAYIKKSERKDTVQFVKQVMAMLMAGPKSDNHTSVIPSDVLLRGVSLSEEEAGTVNIDLSKEYYTSRSKNTSPSEELLARYSIISTLCQFDEIKKVKIYVDGKDMPSSSGKEGIVAEMGASDVMINSPSSIETKTEKFVTLCFTDENGINLYTERRKATMTDNSLEKTVVNELIRGPVSKKFKRTFSGNTELISIETTEGVCFVNFSLDFLEGLDGGNYSSKIAVYSVVNSLTGLPNIEKVQILIDGKKAENDVYELFSTPLARDESMMVNY